MSFYKRFVLVNIIIFLSSMYSLNAQSLIKLKDGTHLEVFIESIDGAQIKYRKNSPTDPKVYFLNSSEIDHLTLDESADYSSVATDHYTEEYLTFNGFNTKFHLYTGANNKQRVKKREMLNLVTNTPAYPVVRTHYVHKTISNIIGYTGVGVVALNGVGLILSAIEGDSELSTAFSGLMISSVIIFTAATLPFTILSIKKGKQGAREYNQFKGMSEPKYTLGFGATRSGIGFKLSF